MGINCEMCEDGFYRPAGIAHYHPDACHMCLCDTIGTMNNLCVKDSSLELDGIVSDLVCVNFTVTPPYIWLDMKILYGLNDNDPSHLG